MNKEIYKKLQEVAKSGNVTNYSDIAPLANLDMSNPDDRNKISVILDEISEKEHEEGRPLLSTVVIHKDNNMPGKGYFKMAKRIGLHTGNDDFMFYINELRKVHNYYKA